jgi:2-aminoadipate transaminase
MQPTYLQQFLSDSARRAKRSEIRELLKLIARPEVISLAGGLPSPRTFPIDELCEVVPKVLREHGAAALQYGPTEGDAGLLDELIKLMEDQEGLTGLTHADIMITTAAQQGLDIISRAFLAPGDAVVCGLPSYLGALSVCTAAGARMVGIPLDDHGIRTDLMEEQFVALRRKGIRPKIIYVVPDFQNPAGVTLSLQRRREILEIAAEFDTLVVEDSPYRHLRYIGETLPLMKSLDRDGRVMTLFTFSKMLFPGLRLGWIIADPEVILRLVVAKQPLDLCTSPFAQVLAREYLRTGAMKAQVGRSSEIYAEKRRVFLDALEREIDPSWGVRWTNPEGGLFLWMTLPEGLHSRELLDHALKENVAFVTGMCFHCDGGGQNCMRLNFSFPEPEQLQEAAKRLGRAIGRMVEENPQAARKEAGWTREPAVDIATSDHTLDQLSLNLALTEVVE